MSIRKCKAFGTQYLASDKLCCFTYRSIQKVHIQKGDESNARTRQIAGIRGQELVHRLYGNHLLPVFESVVTSWVVREVGDGSVAEPADGGNETNTKDKGQVIPIRIYTKKVV